MALEQGPVTGSISGVIDGHNVNISFTENPNQDQWNNAMDGAHRHHHHRADGSNGQNQLLQKIEEQLSQLMNEVNSLQGGQGNSGSGSDSSNSLGGFMQFATAAIGMFA